MFKLIDCCILVLSAAVLTAGELSPQAHPAVAVIVDYERSRSAVSFSAMQAKLESIMSSVGLQVKVFERSQLKPDSEFGDLLVFKMRGSCDASAWPVGALSDERGPLAMAYASDGEVLPFGEVECDRIRESLGRILGNRIRLPYYGSLYGSALGMVMAHEIYHMLAHQSRHTESGVTKDKFSARELLEGNLSFPQVAREALRSNTQARH